jgi:hypothetical protein
VKGSCKLNTTEERLVWLLRRKRRRIARGCQQLTGRRCGSTTWLEIMEHRFLVKIKELSPSEREKGPTYINLISFSLRPKLLFLPRIKLEQQGASALLIEPVRLKAYDILLPSPTPSWITLVIRLCRSAFQL